MQPIEDDAGLRLFFLDEAESLVNTMLTVIREFITGRSNAQAPEDIRRGFHTLKGGAAQMSGYDSMADCCQQAERLAQGLVRKVVVPNPALLGLLADAACANLGLIEAARTTGIMPKYPETLRERLERANQRLLAVECAAMNAADPLFYPQPIVDASE